MIQNTIYNIQYTITIKIYNKTDKIFLIINIYNFVKSIQIFILIFFIIKLYYICYKKIEILSI